MNRLALTALLALAAFAGRAQDTVSIPCAEVLAMPMLEFDLGHLPDGLLDCMDGHPADAGVMRKWAQILSANIGDGYTVGDMKAVLDSVDAADGYRAAWERVEACKERYARRLDPADWPGDSAAFTACGMDPEAVALMGGLLRRGEVPADTPLRGLLARYQKALPALLAERAAGWALPCPGAERPWSHGLQVYDDPAAAMACARATGRPILFVLAGWAHGRSDHLAGTVMADAVLFRRVATQTVPMVLYADDPAPLPEGAAYRSARLDTLVDTRGLLAQDWALRAMDLRHPLGIALLDAEGRPLASHLGSIDRFALEALIDEARAKLAP